MTIETVSAADLAALQVFLPSAQRVAATFQRAWATTSQLREEVCTNRVSPVDYLNDPGTIWTWNYTRSPPAPASSYLALGLRFPEQSDWWKGAPLPEHPHAFLMIGSDNEQLPVHLAVDAPNGWVKIDKELVVASKLQDFPSSSDEFSAALADWAYQRMEEAIQIVLAMSK